MNWLPLCFDRRNHHILFLLAPLLVLVIANVLFEYSLEPSEGDRYCIKGLFALSRLHPSKLSAVGEIGARYLWLASCIAMTVTSLASIAISLMTMRTCLPRGRFTFATLLALAAAITDLVYLQVVPTNLKCVNFDLTLELLRRSSRFSSAAFLDQQIQPVAYFVVAVSTFAAIFLLVAATSTAGLPRMISNTDTERAGIHMAHLRNVLYIGSIMLITGVINMGAWMRWPTALFPADDASEIIGMALGVTTFWGATFTLTAIAAYVPPALYLRTQALEAFRQNNADKTLADQEDWLKDHGLTISPGSQLVPIAAMAGPLIASPLGALLNHVVKQLAE